MKEIPKHERFGIDMNDDFTDPGEVMEGINFGGKKILKEYGGETDGTTDNKRKTNR